MRTITSVKGEYVERRANAFRIRAVPGSVEIDECVINTDEELSAFVAALHASARDARKLSGKPGHKPAALPRSLNNGAWPSLEVK